MDDPGTRKIQERFSAWVRAGEGPPPSGFPAQRAQIYRELVFNNMSSLLSSRLTRLRQALPAPRWRGLIEAYLRSKRARTPLFHQMGGEFVAWLMDAGLKGEPRRQLLLDLAHFDWLSGHLEVQEDPQGERLVAPSEVERAPGLGWSAEAAVARYGYGVQLADRRLREAPAETFLLLRRTPQGEVRWEALGAGAARLGELVRQAQAPMDARQLVAALAEEAGAEPGQLREAVVSALRLFAQRRALVHTGGGVGGQP